MKKDDRCEFGKHCKNQGKIQVYLSKFDLYACVQCVSVEENVTIEEVWNDAKGGNPDIEIAAQRMPDNDLF